MWKLVASLVAVFGTTMASAQIGELIDISPSITSGDIDYFTFTPDGQSIVMIASLDDGLSGDQVYSVPRWGGSATLISDPSLNGDIDEDVVTDGTFVYYEGDGNTGDNNNNEIWQARLDGQRAPIAITSVDGAPSTTGDQKLINRGRTLLYLFDGAEDLIFGVGVSGGTATQLSPSGIDMDRNSWRPTANGSSVIAAAPGPNGGDQVRFLNITLDGSQSFSEITPVGVTSDFAIGEIELTQDDSTVFFTAVDGAVTSGQGLYKMDLATGLVDGVVPLTDSFQDIDEFALSPDESMVAFIADLEENGSDELFVVNADGTGLINLTADIPSFTDVQEIAWGPDGQFVYFTADQRTNGVEELYRVFVPAPSGLVAIGLAGITAVRRRR